jgi:hypothetical protein
MDISSVIIIADAAGLSEGRRRLVLPLYVFSAGRRCFFALALYTGATCPPSPSTCAKASVDRRLPPSPSGLRRTGRRAGLTAAAAGQVRNRDAPGMCDTKRDSAGCAATKRDTGVATFMRNRLGVCCIYREPVIFPFGGAVAPPSDCRCAPAPPVPECRRGCVWPQNAPGCSALSPRHACA